MISILLFIIVVGAIIMVAIAFRRTQELSVRVDFLQREIDILRGKISRLQPPTEAQPEARNAPSVRPPIPPTPEPPKPRVTPPPFPTDVPPVIHEPVATPISSNTATVSES